MSALTADQYFRTSAKGAGPVAALICEDGFQTPETVAWLRERGFAEIVAFGPGVERLEGDDSEDLAKFKASVIDPADRTKLLNRLIGRYAGRWMLICFNGEFLFHPFSETRKVVDFIEFLWSERRTSAMTYAIDLYDDEMGAPGAFDLKRTYFDRQGWYGFEREDGLVDVFGGLGWRFEEYVPADLTRINRPALFQADPEVAIGDDLWFEDAVVNSISCPWHNNATLALMSCRRARLLTSHPQFAQTRKSLIWPNSELFQWRSGQLIEHGLIEAGQWI